MRRRSRGERTPLNADINVVSLIDVMMLLMVIFMITAPMMQGGVDVALPKAQAAPLESKSGLTVSIDSNRRIYVDETRYSLSDFRVYFRTIAKSRAKGGVYLRVDEGVNYGLVAQVMAILSAAGVKDVGRVLEPEQVVK